MRRREAIALLAAPLFAADDNFATFTDVAKAAGLTPPIIYGGVQSKKYILETNGCGVAFLDYDNDGWMDIFLGGGSRLEGHPGPTSIRLYRNNRNGTFTDVNASSWDRAHCLGLRSLCWRLYNDSHEDIFLSCWGANLLYRNNGNGTFTDVSKECGLAGTEGRWSAGCTFPDYNRDGYFDLFVSEYLEFDLKKTPLPGANDSCAWKGIPVNRGLKGLPTGRNRLYRNNGPDKQGRITFTDVSEESGVAKITGRYGMTAVSADFDDDGWPDIFVACDSTPSVLYRNNHDGTFTDIGLQAGVAVNEDDREQAGMGVALGDTRNRSKLDLFKTHFMDDTPVLYSGAGNGIFEDITSKAGFGEFTKYVGWGTGFADFDNDGWQDLFWVNSNVYPEIEKSFPHYKRANPRILVRNLRNGRFADYSKRGGPGVTTPHSNCGCAFGAFNNDGNVDVLIMNMNEPPSLLRNDLKNGNHWLKLKLTGVKSNRSAIGASVYVTVEGRRQRQDVLGQSSFYSQNDPRLHFGLGKAMHGDLVDIHWPSGLREVHRNLKANQILTLKEGAGEKLS